jgi:hypothetical protein
MPDLTPAAELRAAAERLRQAGNAALMDVLTNDYWNSEIVPADDPDGRYAHGMRGGMGGESGDLAAIFTPGVVTLLAEWLDTAADYAEPGVHFPTHIGRAYAVARSINTPTEEQP